MQEYLPFVNSDGILLIRRRCVDLENREEQRLPMVEGVIWKQLLRFFFPILLGTFFQQLYNTADALIVGRILGEHALAAVGGSSSMITTTVINFFTGLTSGAAIIASQMLGAGNRKGVNDSIHTVYGFALVVGILLSIVGVRTTRVMLHGMNTPESLMADSESYLKIFFAGLVFILIYNTGASVLRALGDARRPFWYLLICCIVNVVLDYVLIAWFSMGVGGAAAATVIAQGISAVLVTLRLMKFREACDFRLRNIWIHPGVLKREIVLGLPSGVQAAMYSVSNIIVTAALNGFGEVTVASWTALGKFDSLFWMISGAMGVAITTFAGQNYGAGKYERIRKGVRVINVAYVFAAILVSALIIFLREQLLGVFLQSREAVEIGCKMILIISPFYIANIYAENYAGALRGVGDTLIPMIFSVFGICVFRVIYLSVWFPLNPTLEMLCAMYPVSWILTNTFYMIYYPIRMKKMMRW